MMREASGLAWPVVKRAGHSNSVVFLFLLEIKLFCV